MRVQRAKKLVAFGCHLLFVGAVQAMPVSSSVTGIESLKAPTNYHLVWADEFETAGLPDPTRWAYDTSRNKPGWHNRELQYYSGPRAENAVVRDGRLVITNVESEVEWHEVGALDETARDTYGFGSTGR